MAIKRLLLIQLLIPIILFSADRKNLSLSSKQLINVRKNYRTMRSLLGIESHVINNIEYDVNVMWINKELKKEQKGISPENDTFIATILGWAKCNENGIVNVWFDSQSTSAEAIKNTQAKLNKYSGIATIAPIALKDIRSLPEVQENSDVFSTKMPVYFRVDLARSIVLHNAICDKESTYYSVYSDLDIVPISREYLFDSETLSDLKQHGIVMAKYNEPWWVSFYKSNFEILSCGYSYYESGFQILSSEQKKVVQAHKEIVIDASIKKGRNKLKNDLVFRPEGIIWRKYRAMFASIDRNKYNNWDTFPQKDVNYPIRRYDLGLDYD
jgi:hypothetical protein